VAALLMLASEVAFAALSLFRGNAPVMRTQGVSEIADARRDSTTLSIGIGFVT